MTRELYNVRIKRHEQGDVHSRTIARTEYMLAKEMLRLLESLKFHKPSS